jgi:hypothetical protein
MISSLGKLTGEGVAALVKDQLDRAADFETGRAAPVWRQDGDPDALTRLIEDWWRLPPGGQGTMVEPVALRFSIVLAFGEEPYCTWDADGKAPPRADEKALMDRAAERLLVRELLDTEVYRGVGMLKPRFTSPRVCGGAGAVTLPRVRSGPWRAEEQCPPAARQPRPW